MDADFRWFIENYKALQEKYGDCFLAIKDSTVLGSYGSYGEAVRETEKTEELGTFIVQECQSQGAMYQACIASMNFS